MNSPKASEVEKRAEVFLSHNLNFWFPLPHITSPNKSFAREHSMLLFLSIRVPLWVCISMLEIRTSAAHKVVLDNQETNLFLLLSLTISSPELKQMIGVQKHPRSLQALYLNETPAVHAAQRRSQERSKTCRSSLIKAQIHKLTLTHDMCIWCRSAFENQHNKEEAELVITHTQKTKKNNISRPINKFQSASGV